jgi:hypothetical protein
MQEIRYLDKLIDELDRPRDQALRFCARELLAPAS